MNFYFLAGFLILSLSQVFRDGLGRNLFYFLIGVGATLFIGGIIYDIFK